MGDDEFSIFTRTTHRLRIIHMMHQLQKQIRYRVNNSL